ncbi:MAG: T9SS type A sorting domain-containing protein [Dysgonamonadaceae bacterium]|jgi:hypothetical protein|nr:T9SS type A sorting domain-containing protein [Dysgonamonadaceae bacterium]
MNKQFLFLLIAACGFFTANAQITVDGIVNDWETVPVLSEPGVFPFAKVVSDDARFYFLVTLNNDNTFDPNAWFTVDLYIDADFSSETGYRQWIYTGSGIDYLVQGTDLNKFTGANGTDSWSWTTTGSSIDRAYSADGRSAELSIAAAGYTAVALAETWGVALGPYYFDNPGGGDPSLFMQSVEWNFTNRKVFVVKPRTEISLNGSVELIAANAFYHPFMKAQNIVEYLDFQSGDWAAQNTLHWAAWAVNLSAPATFNFKMTTQSTASGKARLTLVDRTTNAVVKTFDDVWYPVNNHFDENDYGTLDLSDVPAGKYMLKLTHPTDWDTFLKVSKVTLTNLSSDAIKPVDVLENVTVIAREKGFTLASEKAVNVYVYSVEGKIISNYKQVNSINQPLNSGFYLLNIQSNGKQIVRKIAVK